MLKASIKNIFEIALRIIFQAMLFLFIIFTVLEIIKPRIITSCINISWFVFGLLVVGILAIIFLPSAEKKESKLKFLGNLTAILFSILFGIFIAYWIRGIGGLGIVVGTASIFICYVLIRLVKNS